MTSGFNSSKNFDDHNSRDIFFIANGQMMLRSIFRSDFASYLTQKRSVLEVQKAMQFKKIGHYYLLSKIGSGSSGKVYFARVDSNYNREENPNQIYSHQFPSDNFDLSARKPNQEINVNFEGNLSTTNFAIKAIKLQAKHSPHATMPANLEREIRLMKILNHPNIVKLHDVLCAPSKSTAYLVIDWAQYGSLQKAIVNNIKFDEMGLAAIFLQVIDGISYLHSQGIVHHDIKPSNILLFENGNVKLSDFGAGHNFGSAFTVIGTPAYQAPELLVDDNPFDISTDAFSSSNQTQIDLLPTSDSDQDSTFSNTNSLSSSDGFYYLNPAQADVWSLGVTMYETAFGMLPYRGENYYEIVNDISNNPLTIPSNFEYSELFINLLREMLQPDPNQRISLDGIKQHPFFAQYSHNLPSRLLGTLKDKMASLNSVTSNQLTMKQSMNNIIEIPVEPYQENMSFSMVMQPATSVYKYLNSNTPPTFEPKNQVIL